VSLGRASTIWENKNVLFLGNCGLRDLFRFVV